MKKVSILLCAVLCLGLLLTACTAEELTVQQIKDKGTIIMCTNAEFEPFEFMDNGVVVGIDAEIAQEIANDLGVKLEIVNISFNSLIPAVKQGKYEFAAAGMTIKPDRLKSVNFTDTYFNASQSIIVLKDSAIKTAADLEGKTIGVQEATTGDEYCTDNVKGATIQRYANGPVAVQALISGKLDAVVIDDFPATALVNKNSDSIIKLAEPLTKEEYAIAVRKENVELLEAINASIARIKASGRFDEIVLKYVPIEE